MMMRCMGIVQLYIFSPDVQSVESEVEGETDGCRLVRSEGIMSEKRLTFTQAIKRCMYEYCVSVCFLVVVQTRWWQI